MDLVLLFTLSLCCWSADGRSLWTDKPWLIVSSDEMEDGETVKVTCTLPIDYRGGDCRLFEENSRFPFKLMTATDFLCQFHLTSRTLLGHKAVGSKIYFKCDYHLQQYTSAFSDIKAVIVWGTRPSPVLSVSHHFVSPNERVEVNCSPPSGSASRCSFYRDEFVVVEGPCRRNMTGKQLAIWRKSSTLLPVNLTCRYYPYENVYIRSERSDRKQLFVVDTSQVSSSLSCQVSVEDEQLAAFSSRNRTFVGADGTTVTVQVTNSQLTPDEICRPTDPLPSRDESKR